ncbi:MAG: ferrous iron transport protein A [Gammaproteobacteria bacterium]
MKITLDQLAINKKALVTGFGSEGPVMQRLMQLGVLEGSELEIIRTAPGGDPIEIRVMGYCLSLRKAEAQMVLVESL